MKTKQELFKEALEIQNACNIVGLARRFAEVTKEVKELSTGTCDTNTSPIITLWLDKFNSLNKIQFDSDPINRAYIEAFEANKE